MQIAITRMRVVKNKQLAKNQHTTRDIAELLANHRYDNARYKVWPPAFLHGLLISLSICDVRQNNLYEMITMWRL